MIELDTFYDKINKDQYSFGEFLKVYPDFLHYAMNALEEKLGCYKNSNNYAIKVNDKNAGFITVHSLLPEFNFNESYTDLIPENGLNYKVDATKIAEEICAIDCSVSIPTHKPITITFTLKKAIFKVNAQQPIKFPDDYFSKGYPILGEISASSILNNNVINFPDKRKQYAEIKQLCLFKIKQAS